MPSSHLSALMMLSSQLLSTGRFNEGLPAFITRGLDSEQIWQQLELRNDHKSSLTACTREVIRIQSDAGKRHARSKQKKDRKVKKISTDDAVDDADSHSSDSLEDENMINTIKKRLDEQPLGQNSLDNLCGTGSEDSEEDDVDFDFEMDKELSKGLSDEDEDLNESSLKTKTKDKKLAKTLPKKPSVVDDKFFKLAEMEDFLDSEDGKEEKRKKKEEKNETVEEESEDEDEAADEDVDMFNDLDDEDDDAMGAMYVDFFDPPEDGSPEQKARVEKKKKHADNHVDGMSEDNEESDDVDEESDDPIYGDEIDEDDEDKANEDEDDVEHESEGGESTRETEADKEEERKTSKKSVSFEKDLLESDEEAIDEKVASKSSKSSFEKKQEQLQAEAREMEEQSLKEAPWELTGETTASKRPENSLLETVLDFQHTTRAAPVITDETTKSLEDYIKQRIKDKAFDDVERKEKPKEDPFEFKKRIVLDQEKSKLSLGELYEQEFLKQQQEDKEEVKADPECEKIETDLKKLFQQLDALCNFRYTPMKAGTEVKILVNTPAITMEEVAPTATADAQLLAPEEVKEKIKGDLKADDERDSTDKKRDRRHKKTEKRLRNKAKEAREKVVEKMKPGLGNKYSKAKAIKQLEQISKTDRNVTVIKAKTEQVVMARDVAIDEAKAERVVMARDVAIDEAKAEQVVMATDVAIDEG
ncbi:U3 small nucleolar ribonucleoprotein protein mpp10 [Plakobranchus ocellatus]|uniref:U3 small nucleolar ribonucleoprotein protein MPP10 n=1 Tax=Plakobranchus ocellatus TaxID=259542 RepID=A0AAV3ZCJ0_9GAST|nr:U3 small nucleolar ribonucleoprotein protein mpp10 [Plakobranchus ocellatus]